MKCDECGTEHDVVVLHSRCHDDTPTWIWYNQEHGTAEVRCAECGLTICTMEVTAIR
jgi:uncharacterized Zn finger protein